MRRSIMVNPMSDAGFVDAAERALETAGTHEALAEALRDAYPDVVVRPRSLSGESFEIWYVYRDGRWVDPGGGRSDVGDRGGLRTTAEAIKVDAERVKDIEEEKLGLDGDDPRVPALAVEAEVVAERLLEKAKVERALAAEQAAEVADD